MNISVMGKQLSLAPFFLSALLGTTLPFSAAIVDPCRFLVQASYTLGTHGADGRNGRNGEVGRSGYNRTIRANDTPVIVNIQGQDGRDGEDGERGGRPVCNHHHEPKRNLTAAAGGDGGNGGRGGDGGNGGQLTVYYQDLSQLRNIAINAAGGEGGRGGYGGYGMRGCECHDRRWQIVNCTDGDCTTENYTCTDGDDGRDGYRGRDGNPGEMGYAKLINQTEPLAAENQRVESAIAALPNTPITLSRNLWETRSGAQLLFSPNSVVSDRYQTYIGRVEQQFQLQWAAQRPQSELSSQLNIAITEQGNLQINPANDLWIDSNISTETTPEGSTLTTYRVDGAIHADEATQLTLGRHSGSGNQLTLNVIDRAGTSDLVQTRFYLRYRTNTDERRPRYVTRYEAEIPATLIAQNYNRFSLPIGQLPIDRQHLTRGTEARVELVVSRSYAGNTAEQTLDWNGRL